MSRFDDGSAWMVTAWCLGVLAVMACGALIYDVVAGSEEMAPGVSGHYVHHDAWDQWVPPRISKVGKMTVYHPGYTIHHPAYDETPISYSLGTTWIRARYDPGMRFLVPVTTGRLTGWHYTGTAQLEPRVE